MSTTRPSRQSSFARRVTTAGFGVLFLAGCGGAGSPASSVGGSSGTLAVVAPPVIESFTADPNPVVDGKPTTLSWVVSDPDATLQLAPLGKEVTGSTVDVEPVITTTYTLTATNAGGTATATAVVSVVSEDVTTPSSAAPPPEALQTVGDWQPVAGNLVDIASQCGNLSAVFAHPTDDLVIASMAVDGLWGLSGKSDQWSELGKAGHVSIVNRATAVIFDPQDQDTWWESGMYSDPGPGVAKTTDNGASFKAAGNVQHVDGLSIDLGDPQRLTMLAGTHEQRKLMRSEDAGATWQDITAGLPEKVGFTSSAYVIDPSTYLAGTRPSQDPSRDGQEGVYRTTNGGTSWTQTFNMGVIGQPLATEDGTLYWLLAGGFGLIKSTDSGVSWTFTGQGPHADPGMSIIELPGGRLATTTGGYVISSADGGATWTPVGGQLPYDLWGVAYSAAQNALYTWHSDCVDQLEPDSIVRLDLAPLTG